MKDESGNGSGARSAAPAEAPSEPDPSSLAAGFSKILAELAHAPEAELGRWAPAPVAGETLGRFVLKRELGRGGMGVVWEAEDPTLARRVALKVVRSGTRASARGEDWIRREAEAVARLNHPAIVTLHDHGLSEAGPFLVFERLHGRTLDRALLDGPLPFPAVLQLGLAVAGALDHAHRSEVVHRDLKPGNVFMLEGGGVKVLDFGLASLLGQSGLGDAGTPAFMAPEQWRDELGDARTDLFALGVTLWNALTGALPYPVTDGRSAAAGPGEAPRLPRDTAPARFRRLVERCLEREPGARPASAREVLEVLRTVAAEREGRGRRMAFTTLLAAAVAGFASAGWLWWTGEPAPGDRLATVVAEVRNQSGDPALDDLARLLTTSLEQSRRLTLLSRPRLAALAREARLDAPDRLDGPRALELARLGGAKVLLLPEARREGDRLIVEVRAVDPEHETPLFGRSATFARTDGLLGAVDQVAEGVRRKLHERRDDLAAGRIQLASAISPNLEAAQAYYRGLDCWWRPKDLQVSTALACPPFMEAALAADPAFALAHFRLAQMTFLRGTTAQDARPHVAAAMAAIDRLPAREALLLRSWAGHVEGRDAEAMALADEALARYPDDTEALDQAATMRIGRYDYAGAIPYLERLVALESADGTSRGALIEALVALDRRDGLRKLAGELESLPATPTVDRDLADVYLGLGRPEEAVARAKAATGRPGQDPGRPLLRRTLVFAGRFAEVEPFWRGEVAARPDDQLAALTLAGVLVGQGRLEEALRTMDEAEYRSRSLGPGAVSRTRALLLAGDGGVDRLWRAAGQAWSEAPEENALLAIALALRGDLRHAEQLGDRLAQGPVREQYQALLAWRRGDATEAAARLQRQLAAGLDPPEGMHPGYLLAVVSLASGQPAVALAGIDRFRRSLAQGWWTRWAWPRSRLLAARAHVALGHWDLARGELDRLLADLGRADPGLPLLEEARALRTELARR